MNNLLLVKNVRGHAYFVLFVCYEPWKDIDIGAISEQLLYGDSFSFHFIQIG